jgi:hypothetical protein
MDFPLALAADVRQRNFPSVIPAQAGIQAFSSLLTE